MTSRQIETASVTPASVETLLFRYPVETPVRTSFGVMHDRPALFVRVTDADGTVGWGEVWCNFPTVGAEHRALDRLAIRRRRPGQRPEARVASEEDDFLDRQAGRGFFLLRQDAHDARHLRS